MRWRQGLAYGQVQETYKGSRVEGVAGRAVHGTARLELDELAVGGPLQFLSASQRCDNHAGGPGDPSQSGDGSGRDRAPVVHPCMVASACSWGAEIIAGHYRLS
jgi:hypothetical protein